MEEAQALHRAVNSLIENKTVDKEDVRKKLRNASYSVQEDREKIKTYKRLVKINRLKLDDLLPKVKIADEIKTILIDKIAKHSTTDRIEISEDIGALIDNYTDFLYNENDEANAEELVTRRKELTCEQAQQLVSILSDYRTSKGAVATDLINNIKVNVDKLQDAYLNAAEHSLRNKQEKLLRLETFLAANQQFSNSAAFIELCKQKNAIQGEIIELKLNTHRTAEDLVKHNLIRGLPSQNVTLLGFNLEDMLKKASEMTSASPRFHLMEENCSITSMKILHAGATTAEVKGLFQWSEKKSDEKVASNSLLTNPQSVYSAARVADDYRLGKAEAKHYVEHGGLTPKDKRYYRFINSFLALDNDVLIKKTSTFLGRMRLFFSFIPHLFSLLRDWRPFSKVADQNKSDSFLFRLGDAVKNPTTKTYDRIQQPTPLLAIHAMVNQLRENHASIPFYDDKTLKIVNEYILSIEAKEPKTEEEVALLKNYQNVLQERNERVECMEQALFAGKEPASEISNRVCDPARLQWTIIHDEIVEQQLYSFTKIYSGLRKQESLPLLRSNFIEKLSKYNSSEDKLKAIIQHQAEKPQSRTAKAWSRIFKERGSKTETARQDNTPEEPSSVCKKD